MSWSTESIKPNAPATWCLNGRFRILQMMDHLASVTWKVYVQTINSSLTALFGRHHHLQQRIVQGLLYIQSKWRHPCGLTAVHDRSSWTERMPAARYGPISDPDTIMSLPLWNSPTKVEVRTRVVWRLPLRKRINFVCQALTSVPSRQTTHITLPPERCRRHTQSQLRK
jgi:hypothetical protein